MFKQIIVISAFVSVVIAGGLKTAGYGAGYGGLIASGPALAPGLALAAPALAPAALVSGPAYAKTAAYASAPAIVTAAVQSRHHVQYYDVPTTRQITPITIDVGANVIPVNMIFRSASSQLNVEQNHLNQGGSVQETASQDEPHILRHSVQKPILQEIREVIIPMRRIQQEIQPVQEEVSTLVARGHQQTVVAAAPVAAAPVVAAAPIAAAPVVAAAPVAPVAAVSAGPALVASGPALAAAPISAVSAGPAFVTGSALASPALIAAGPAEFAGTTTLLAQGGPGFAFGNGQFAGAAPFFAGKLKYRK
ncbi:uncharacterized protein LOC124493776 [Dermatophagoides farinae]|uniref:uncharacterized protein LOC124493776 n=1 Tax=Dermatophagoides farinae TaxID=6954 RepID=UPI003F62F8C7